MPATETDSGAGSMLALSLIFASVACFGAVQIGSSQVFSQIRLNSTAEQAAIAADDSLRGLTTGFPCEIAKKIALANMAILDECRIVGFEAFINLHVVSMGIVLNASARAGPSN
jgi:secretion/DNA translocation related TadE-like protein